MSRKENVKYCNFFPQLSSSVRPAYSQVINYNYENRNTLANLNRSTYFCPKNVIPNKKEEVCKKIIKSVDEPRLPNYFIDLSFDK